jgi:hypothetical protein
MRRNTLNSFLLLICLSTAFGCKAKREIIRSAAAVKADKSSKAGKLLAITNSSLDYSSLSIKARADLNIDGNENDVSMNIRIRKGEAIWVFVTAFAGLEVARALITPDSVKILNKLENTYTRKPFSYIYNFANDQINFETLESIFAGNPQKEFVTGESEMSIQGNQVILAGMLESLAYSVRFNEMNKVVETRLRDEGAAQDLSVSYGDFIKNGGIFIPHTVNINSQVDGKNVVINLKYSRVDLNQAVDMPFSVPKKFTVKN